jgi:hypothetical protein
MTSHEGILTVGEGVFRDQAGVVEYALSTTSAFCARNGLRPHRMPGLGVQAELLKKR